MRASSAVGGFPDGTARCFILVAAACGLAGCWLVSLDVPADAAMPEPRDAFLTTVVTPGDVIRPCVPGSGGQPGALWAMSGGGPEHHGRSSLLGPSQPAVWWVFEPDLDGEPIDFAVDADGAMYFMVKTTQDWILGSYILALAPSGEALWRFWDDWGHHAILYGGVAIGRNGTIYTPLWNEASFAALSPGGELLWKQEGLHYHLYSSVIAGDDVVLVVGGFPHRPSEPAPNYLWAFTPSGEELFRVDYDAVMRTPAIGADCTIYVGSHHHVIALDTGGREKWRLATGYRYYVGGPNLGPDGTIYVSGGISLGDEEHPCAPRDLSALLAVSPQGAVKWKLPYCGTPAGDHAIGEDGTIYFGSQHDWDGEVLAVSPEGDLLWTLPMAGFMSGYVYGKAAPTIDASGVLHVGTTGDGLYAIWPDGRVRWHFDPGDESFERLVIGHDQVLYVIAQGPMLTWYEPPQSRIYAIGDPPASP